MKKYPVICQKCGLKSYTTDKETSYLNKWICWKCVNGVKKRNIFQKIIAKIFGL